MLILLKADVVNALRLQYANALVTEKTARMIAKSCERSPTAPRLDATSQHVFDPGAFVDSASRERARLSIIREAIAERMLRLIDTLALNAATRNRSCREVAILEPSGSNDSRFTEEVANGLAERLGLENAAEGLSSLPRTSSPLGSLAHDLFEWSAENLIKADELMQLVVDVPRRTVNVRCPDVSLVRGERTARR